MSEQPAAVDTTGGAGPVVGNTFQIAMLARDLHRGLDNLVALGIGPFQVVEIGPHNCTEQTFRGEPASWSCKAAFTMVGPMMWEVIQPLEGPSVYSEWLDAGHEGFHHVAVDGGGLPFDERVAALERGGYSELMGGRAYDGAVPFGYFHNGDPAAPVVEIVDIPEGFTQPEPDEWYPAPPPAA